MFPFVLCLVVYSVLLLNNMINILQALIREQGQRRLQDMADRKKKRASRSSQGTDTQSVIQPVSLPESVTDLKTLLNGTIPGGSKADYKNVPVVTHGRATARYKQCDKDAAKDQGICGKLLKRFAMSNKSKAIPHTEYQPLRRVASQAEEAGVLCCRGRKGDSSSWSYPIDNKIKNETETKFTVMNETEDNRKSGDSEQFFGEKDHLTHSDETLELDLLVTDESQDQLSLHLNSDGPLKEKKGEEIMYHSLTNVHKPLETVNSSSSLPHLPTCDSCGYPTETDDRNVEDDKRLDRSPCKASGDDPKHAQNSCRQCLEVKHSAGGNLPQIVVWEALSEPSSPSSAKADRFRLPSSESLHPEGNEEYVQIESCGSSDSDSSDSEHSIREDEVHVESLGDEETSSRFNIYRI